MSNSDPVRPVLIMGAPGSGTTLLYETLCAHKDLSYITLNMLRSGIHRHGKIVGNSKSALFKVQNLLHRDPASFRPHEANAFWIKYFGTYNYLTENHFTPEMAAYYRKNVVAAQKLWNRPRFVNKNLQHCVRVRLLNKIFPDAKFIHIIRDGRAVAYSIFNKKESGVKPTMFLIGLKNILGEKFRSERSELFNYGLAWTELVKKAREADAFGSSRYYELRYENLITRPYDEVQNVLDFCELSWYSAFEKNIPKTSNMNMKWKKDASEDQRNDLEESTLDLRQTLGIA